MKNSLSLICKFQLLLEETSPFPTETWGHGWRQWGEGTWQEAGKSSKEAGWGTAVLSLPFFHALRRGRSFLPSSILPNPIHFLLVCSLLSPCSTQGNLHHCKVGGEAISENVQVGIQSGAQECKECNAHHMGKGNPWQVQWTLPSRCNSKDLWGSIGSFTTLEISCSQGVET